MNALSLPDTVQTQIVTGSFDDLPVLQLAVTGSGNQEQLVDRLNATAVPDLEKLDGVRQADVFGNPGRRVVITPDEDELASRGLTTQSISDALDDNGTLIPGGTITQDGRTLSVQTGERIASLDDIRGLPLTASSGSGSSGSGLVRFDLGCRRCRDPGRRRGRRTGQHGDGDRHRSRRFR